MAKVKNKRIYSVYVKLNALVSFNVLGDNPEAALEEARKELNKTQFIADGIEYCDGTEIIQGVLEND